MNVRYACRALARQPGFTLAALATLALGIGANTTIFSFLNALLLRPLPFPDSGNLVVMRERAPGFPEASVALPNFLDWERYNQVFERMGALRNQSYNLTGRDEPLRVLGGDITAGLFPTLGVGPRIGRNFTAGEDRPGAHPVVILSDGLWKRAFGADHEILGRQVVLSGVNHTVIGVMPPAYLLPPGAELWTPLGPRMADPGFAHRGNHPGIQVIGRLKPGVGMDRARADLDAIAERLEKQYPDTNTGNRVAVLPLQDRMVRNIKPALRLLMGGVGFVLLIACANVANLLLARAMGRQREIAIRAALGASRWRIVRQLLSESVLLSLAGGVAGVLLGVWGVDLLTAAIPPDAGLVAVSVDRAVLAFTLAIALATGILFGLAPAWASARRDLHDSLKDGGRGASAGAARQTLRRALVAGEAALALVLLIAAGLMVRSFVGLTRAEPGVRVENVITMQITLPPAAYGDDRRVLQFHEQLLERVRALPGVESVGTTTLLPLTGSGNQSGFIVGGRPLPERGRQPYSDVATVNPEYFQTMGIPLLRGRNFNAQDIVGRPLVAIVDTKMVERRWPNEDPLDKTISFNGPNGPWHTVVGVVGHVKSYGVDAESREETYFAHSQAPSRFLTLAVRTAGPQPGVAAAVRREVLALDRDLPVYTVRTMEEWLARLALTKRVTTVLIASFGAAALLLAAVGLYGVMAYSVSARTPEMGIRMALGAARADLLRLVLREGMTVTGIGVALGLAGALGVTRFMEKLLYEVTPTDTATFLGVAAMLAAVAALACWVPARQAAKVDPLEALRYE
jgi:putative ABC transport system permease protein